MGISICKAEVLDSYTLPRADGFVVDAAVVQRSDHYCKLYPREVHPGHFSEHFPSFLLLKEHTGEHTEEKLLQSECIKMPRLHLNNYD